MRTGTILLFLTLAAAVFLPANVWAARTMDHHVRLGLVPEFSEVKPGDTLFIAITQDIDEDWHTYWENPGDSGEPPLFKWTLPDGFTAAGLSWPVPERVATGPLTSYGYKHSAILLQEIHVPGTLPDGPLTLKANIDILVCKDICIPEYNELTLTLNDGRNEDNSALIGDAFARMPVQVDWDARYGADDNGDFIVNLDFKMPGLITKGAQQVRFDLFPYPWGIVDNTALTRLRLTDDKKHLILRKARGDRPLEEVDAIRMLVTYSVIGGSNGALEITAKPAPAWLAKQPPRDAPQPALPRTTMGMALVFALLGGLILNLMPCVFPVLSMKALGLCQMAEKSHVSARLHGLTYTAGVMLSFLVIAGLLIVLKGAGEQIGWGFQLQNPMVVLGLSYLLFMIGLNFSGFYEISGSFTNVGAGLGRKEGVTESFFTGVLAAIVATPCTAPFMGVAMGFALTQPAAVALTVFAAMGLGLALPYLLLSWVPALRNLLPRPGHWMVTVRKVLAFPLYASALWLIWVYGRQIGLESLLLALSGFVGLGLAVWAFRYGPLRDKSRAVRTASMIVLLAVPVFAMAHSLKPGTPPAAKENAAWQPYTADRLETLLAEDAPVFVNMTADWCITCKINEMTALNSKAVKDAFAARSVVFLKGDWTLQNPDITEFLDRFGRDGVPLYIFYGARDKQTGKRPGPVILPQLLTPGMIVAAVNK